MKLITTIIITSLLILSAQISSAQYYTVNSGDWSDHNTWVEDVPPYTFSNNVTIKVNLEHEVVSEEGLEFNNNVVVDIEGELTINGDVTGNNNFYINVSSNGKFVVNGDVNLHNNSLINLDGEMYVDNLYGFNDRTNYLIGNGDLYLGGEIDGFNTDYFNGSIIDDSLPIDLLSFEAEWIDDGIDINWATATEINNDYFTIEKSYDANNWEVVTYIEAAGNSNNVIEYNYVDNNFSTGTIYYRLKQTDFDGKYEYFSPVAVNITDSGEFKILKVHNTGDNLQIHLQTSGKPANLIISDIQGRIIDNVTVNSQNNIEYINCILQKNYSGNILLLKLYNHSDSNSTKYLVK